MNCAPNFDINGLLQTAYLQYSVSNGDTTVLH